MSAKPCSHKLRTKLAEADFAGTTNSRYALNRFVRNTIQMPMLWRLLSGNEGRPDLDVVAEMGRDGRSVRHQLARQQRVFLMLIERSVVLRHVHRQAVIFSSPGGNAVITGCPSVQRNPSEASSGKAAGWCQHFGSGWFCFWSADHTVFANTFNARIPMPFSCARFRICRPKFACVKSTKITGKSTVSKL